MTGWIVLCSFRAGMRTRQVSWRLALLSTRRSFVAIRLIGNKSAEHLTYSRWPIALRQHATAREHHQVAGIKSIHALLIANRMTHRKPAVALLMCGVVAVTSVAKARR